MLTRKRFAMVVVSCGVAAALAMGAYTVVHTQQEDAATANGVAITQSTVDGLATVAARVQRTSPNYHPDLVTIARQQVDYHEAVRRGLTCSAADASASIAANVNAILGDGQMDAVLITIENSGQAPLGYHLTPEAERTPDSQTVIAKYEQDPSVIAVARKLCAVGRMIATVEAEAPTPSSNKQPPNVAATFRAGLYARATVVDASGSGLDIRYATPTP